MKLRPFFDELAHILLQALGLVPMHQPIRVRVDERRPYTDPGVDLLE